MSYAENFRVIDGPFWEFIDKYCADCPPCEECKKKPCALKHPDLPKNTKPTKRGYSMFCKHKWKLIDKTVLPSAFEQTRDSSVEKFSMGECDAGFFRKAVLVIVACEHCGKIKRYTERNP